MLEKNNQISVSKLWAILLLEVDFTTLSKIVFNTRLIPLLENKFFIPEKIIGGRRNQSIIYVAINKKLVTNIINK